MIFGVNRESKEQNNNLFDKLCLFTSTFYKDDQESINRSQLALDFIRNAHALGIKVVISDGSPVQDGEEMSIFEKNVREVTQENPNITIIRTKKRLTGGTSSTMADERKQALEEGLARYPNVGHFLWIEPEKSNLVTEESLKNLMNTALTTHADFVIPTRKQLADTLSHDKEPSGMHTLPKFQSRTETRANKALWAETGEYHDSYFGPVLLKRGSGTDQYLTSPHPTRGINVLTPIEGKKAGLQVVDASVDYSYDPVQKSFEDGQSDAVGNPIDPEVGKKQSDTYKQKRVIQYMNIVYAGQKSEDIFPTYHKNIIYSQEKIATLLVEDQKIACENFISSLQKKYEDLMKEDNFNAFYKQWTSKLPGIVGAATLLKEKLEKLNITLDKYSTFDFQDTVENERIYKEFKKRHVFLTPTVYKNKVTIINNNIPHDDFDLQSFEKKLQVREQKRK